MNRIVMMVLRNFWRVPGAYGKLCRYAKNVERYAEEEMFEHLRYICRRAIAGGNVEVRVSGVENIPAEGGFLLYGNHQGLFDVVALTATCPRALGSVYKQELKEAPFLRQVVAVTRSVALDRENVRQSLGVIREVADEVAAGRVYVIFPEGTRGKNGNAVGEFHGGSFKAALKVRCPIVPLAFVDSFRVLDGEGSGPVAMSISYLAPIPPEEYEGLKAVELAALVKERIQTAIAAQTE